ncbi:MAG: hypothetical protein Q9M48_08590 [Rhodobacterales bacterium]|nr:hypothetical protein [Rhodobacterales bacterium]
MNYNFTPAQFGQEDEIARLLLAAFTPYVCKMGYVRSGPYPWGATRIADLLRFYASLGFVETRRALPDHGEDRFLRVHMEKLL